MLMEANVGAGFTRMFSSHSKELCEVYGVNKSCQTGACMGAI